MRRTRNDLATACRQNVGHALGGLARWGVVLGQVALLRQSEQVRLDPDRLDQIFVRLGRHAAEDVVCRALRELSRRLAETGRLHRLDEMRPMRKCARSLGAIADQLGMPLLARVAGDVCACSEGGDPVALAATLARLSRVGDLSLAQLWQAPGG